MPAALAATRVSVAGLLRGRDLSGDALLALDEDVVALTTTRGRIAVRIGAIEGVWSTDTTLELYLERGDTMQLAGSTAVGDKQMVNPSASLGQGLPAPPSLHLGSTDQNGTKKVTACVQTSTGAIICKDIVTLNPVTSSEQSWREPVQN